MANNTTLIYEMPGKDISVAKVLFGLPNQYTGGLYVNIWLTGVFGVLFLAGLRTGQGGRKSSLFASFGTFVVTFLLTLLSSFTGVPVAGGNQLIPALIILIGSILWNYIGKGGVQL